MPIFTDTNAESFKANGSGFQFSGTRISDLQASAYTLFGMAADVSGSVAEFAEEIETCVKSVIEGCQDSPRADNLLARVLTFNHKWHEQHGFRQLSDCHVGNYTNVIQPGGGTALYDTAVSLIDSVASYGKECIARDRDVNGIVVIITDGIDESSTLTVNDVKAAIGRAMQGECLESLRTILIGVGINNPVTSNTLKKFQREAGIDQYIEIQDSSPKSFAKVAGFISKSVSSQSQAIGSGGPSQAITF